MTKWIRDVEAKGMVKALKTIMEKDNKKELEKNYNETIYYNEILDIRIEFYNEYGNILLHTKDRYFRFEKVLYFCETNTIERIIKTINIDMELRGIVW